MLADGVVALVVEFDAGSINLRAQNFYLRNINDKLPLIVDALNVDLGGVSDAGFRRSLIIKRNRFPVSGMLRRLNRRWFSLVCTTTPE